MLTYLKQVVRKDTLMPAGEILPLASHRIPQCRKSFGIKPIMTKFSHNSTHYFALVPIFP